MSYNAPANLYAPPPPPPARRSPWLWVGLGCGGMVALVMVLIGVLVFKMTKDASAPFNEKAAVQAMNGFPQYPGSTVNSKATQAVQGPLKWSLGFAADKVHCIAYAVPGPSDQVMTWFDNHTGDGGFERVGGTDETIEKFSQGTQQNQYQKGKDRYLVQVQKNPKVKGDLTLLTIRLENYHGGD